MAKPKPARRTLNSYSVKHISKTIRAGDCVLMRPSDSSKPSYVARVEKIESDSRGSNVRIQVRWYYRPEESLGGRRQFHGSKELFLSDHLDIQSADTIEGKCTVHSFKSYTKLDAVGNDDFFCRFEYNSSTGAFNPDRVPVYCKCEMPYNPDDLMVQCEGCSDWGGRALQINCMNKLINIKQPSPQNAEVWELPLHNIQPHRGCLAELASSFFVIDRYGQFCTRSNVDKHHYLYAVGKASSCPQSCHRFHPTCIDMSPEEAKRVDHFYCHNCSSEDQKRLESSNVSTRIADAKVDTKRRRR